MGKNIFLVQKIRVFTMLSIFAMGCLIAPPVVLSQTSRPGWTRGQFMDQYRNPLDHYYIQFTGDINAVYSNPFDNNAPTRIRNMRFSKLEGLTFETSDNVGFFDDSNVFFAIQHEDIEQPYEFRASYVRRGSIGIIRIRYSDELLEVLLGKNVAMGFRTSANYICFFDLPPAFKEGYERFLSEENE